MNIVATGLLLPVLWTLTPGIEIVSNPAAPRDGSVTLEPARLWRLETGDDLPLRAIVDVDPGPDGTTFILDAWQSRVVQVGTDGRVRRVLGARDPHAPGAFLRPSGMYVERDGSLGILQPRPPRIARLSATGEPWPDLPFARAAGTHFWNPLDVQVAGPHAVLSSLEGVVETGRVRTTHRLRVLTPTGELRATVLEHTESRVPGDLSLDGRTDFRRRWQLVDTGMLWVAPVPLEYRLDVLDLQGKVLRRVEVEYRSRAYAEAELSEMRTSLERSAPDRPVLLPEFEPDVQRVMARPGGEIWVLTSRGHAARTRGTLGVFDVLDTAGVFRRAVEIRVDFDPQRDTYEIEGAVLYVVENGLEAQRDFARTSGGAVVVEEPDVVWDPRARPLAVSAYALPPGLPAAGD